MKKNQTLLSLINNWLIAISPVFLFLLLQTLTGRYIHRQSNHTPIVWLWLCTMVIPISMLLISRWRGPNLAYFTKAEAYKTLKNTLLFYGLLLFVCLLLLSSNLALKLEIPTKINLSYLVLTPLQGILLYLIYTKTRNPQTKTELAVVENTIQKKYASYDKILDVNALKSHLGIDSKGIKQVFVAYDVADEAWVERIQKHLRPLMRDGKIDLWDNERVQVGESWEQAIEEAILEAEIALLLISADFMASDFINQNVLPLLFETAETKNTKIIPIFVRYTFFDNYLDLEKFYSLNHPAKPLASVSDSEQEEVLAALTYAIERLNS